ncbi:MAG: hypothetical protein ACHQT8_01900 [Chlamydiales bacterium]
MKKNLFFCTTLLLFSARIMADTAGGSDSGGLEARDLESLREWINTKRQVTVKEKGGSLAISGEVRSEMQAAYETSNGVRQRGARCPTGIPHETFDVEVNLMLDYRTDRTWSSAKLEFDNDAGIFNGSLNKIKLERAFWGARLIEKETLAFDAEVGRRRLNSFVDTKMQGDSFFDGILLRYDQSFDKIADFYIHAGTMVIDERSRQFGYVSEVGLLDIADTGFYTKYLFIDWDTKSFKHNSTKKHRFDFITSQLLLGYKFIPKKFNKLVVLYLAGVYNHVARKLAISDYKRANAGGYIGFSIGELKKKGDWSLDTQYQLVQAQAIPDFDSAGLGLGNTAGVGFYTAQINGSGGFNTRSTAAGNSNFRGYNITLEYLLTNNLILFQSWTQTHSLDDRIGPTRRFKAYEMEFNYAF